MLLTFCTCSTIRKLNTPKLGRFSNSILVLIFMAGIGHHASYPPSNLILVLILAAGLSHGSNPPSKLKLNLILILIWNLILNVILNLILVLILVAGLSHRTCGGT